MTSQWPFGNKNLYLEGTRTLIKFEENNSKYLCKNRNKKSFISHKIDGGLIPNAKEKKCDYLLIIEESSKKHMLYLIELKGLDYKRAFLQIENSLKLLLPQINSFYKVRRIGFAVNGRLSTTAGVSKTGLNSDTLILLNNINKKLGKYGGKLLYHKTPYEEVI